MIFGGTTEGRILSRRLAARGAEVTVCVATAYGAEEQGVSEGIEVLTGRKTASEMEGIVRGAAAVVDATHPYAAEASRNIRAACEAAGAPYRRLLREAVPVEGAVYVDGAAGAAAYLADRPGNVLLTTGAKEVGTYAVLGPERLYPRILPSHAGLTACEAAGIPHRNVLAMQGPFSQELDEAVIRQYGISWVVTKDGGAAGGFPEKVRAAAACGAGLVVLRRPPEMGDGYEETAAWCEARVGDGEG